MKDRAGRRDSLRQRVLRWNISWQVLDGALFMFYIGVVSPVMVIPNFLRTAGASDSQIGLIAGLPPLLTVLLPLLAAGWAQHRRRQKPMVLFLGVFQRVPVLLIAAAAVVLLPGHLTAFLVFFALMMVVSQGAMQAQLPSWAEMFAKVVPYDRRGMVSAWRTNLGILFTLAGAGLVGGILNTLRFPYDYAALYLIGGLGFSLSMIFLASIRERGATEVDRGNSQPIVWRDAPKLLRADPNFSWFLVWRVVGTIGTALVGVFFSLTAADRFGQMNAVTGKLELSGALQSLYMGVYYAGMFLGSLGGAWLGDRRGHRLGLILVGPLTVVPCLLALVIHHDTMFAVIYLFLGLALGIALVSSMPIIMEFAAAGRRAHYVALVATLAGVATMIGSTTGGVLKEHAAQWLPYALASLLTLVATAVMIFRVREPRQTMPAAIQIEQTTKSGTNAGLEQMESH